MAVLLSSPGLLGVPSVPTCDGDGDGDGDGELSPIVLLLSNMMVVVMIMKETQKKASGPVPS